MQRGVPFVLFFFTFLAGQDADVQNDLKITEARYPLGKYEIVIRQQKRLNPDKRTQAQINARVTPIWCSASVEIKENGKVIDTLEFKEIHPVGWQYGIHFPLKQESSKHIILEKYGDYNSRTLVFTDAGQLFNLAGETFRIFLDRYLIAKGGSADDSHDFSFFDLQKNKLLFTVGWGNPIKAPPPAPRDGKAHIIKLYTNGPELFASVDIVYEYTAETVEHTGYFYKIDLETGRSTRNLSSIIQMSI